MMQIKSFEFNLFGEKTYVIYDTDSSEAAIVDPGMMNERENDELSSWILANELSVKYLIDTHLHIDHVFGDEYVEEKYGVGLSASIEDEFLGDRIAQQAMMFHLNVNVADAVKISNPLVDGEVLFLGTQPIQIIAVPGHSPGSIALYCPTGGFVVTGDALFQGSIGRTDLPGGDHSTLLRSIKAKLFVLPDETTVFPGHGPATKIGIEKTSNPFF